MSRREDAITAAMLLAVFAGAALLALDFAPAARRLPLLAAAAGAVCCAVQVRRELANVRAEKALSLAAEWKLVGWFGALVASVLVIGFDLGAPAFVLAFVRLRERWSLAASVALAALAFALVHWLFGTFLRVPLFRGILLGAVS